MSVVPRLTIIPPPPVPFYTMMTLDLDPVHHSPLTPSADFGHCVCDPLQRTSAPTRNPFLFAFRAWLGLGLGNWTPWFLPCWTTGFIELTHRPISMCFDSVFSSHHPVTLTIVDHEQ